MKKFFLSSFVIVTFGLYVLHQKLEDSAAVVVTPPSSLSQLPTATPELTATVSLPTPTSISTPRPTPSPSGQYKDGQYTGDVTDAFYGNVQVKAIIQGGKIADVQFLDYPHDRETSIYINTQAMPYLKSEAIQAQSANVDIVSGATQTSLAFVKSLGSALAKAH